MRYTSRVISSFVLVLLVSLSTDAVSQVPGILNHQGQISTGATPFTGAGQFKFALVNGGGAVTYWSHDGSSSAGSEPSTSLPLQVSAGRYAVRLGDTAVSGMTSAIPATAFATGDVWLRVWFNDGTNGSQLLAPDKRVEFAGYAMRAAGLSAEGLAKVAQASEAGVKAAIDAAAARPAATPAEQAARDAVLAAMRATLAPPPSKP